jgi:hypothetical protein
MFIGYVYKVDCLKSDKSYIGITTTSLEFRKKTHIQSAFNENHGRYNIHFYKAIRKYDLNFFQWYVIDIVKREFLEELIEELKELEIQYIEEFDTFANWYNKTPGGDLTFRGTPKIIDMYNEEGKLLDSGTIGSIAAKYELDVSAICKVCNRIYNYAGTLDNKRLIFRYIEDSFTDEDYLKVKETPKGKKKGFPIKGYFLDTATEVFSFSSAKEAAEKTGFCYRAIANCANGVSKYSGKLDGRKIT